MSDNAIKQAIQKLAGTHLKDEMHLITAIVNSVSQSDRSATCTPIVGHSPTDIVAYFQADVDDGWLLIPAIGSTVTIVYSTRNLPYIIQNSAISKAYLVTETGIQFQGGEFGGIPVAEYIANALNLIVDAFNLLNTKVNTLSPTPVIPPLIPADSLTLENQSITHGI